MSQMSCTSSSSTLADKIIVFGQIAGIIVELVVKRIVERTYASITRLTYKPPLHSSYVDDNVTRNIVILGASFAGYELARLLSHRLPSGYRIVIVERNDSLHDCWLFPRLSALKGSGIEPKAFVPYGGYIRSAPTGMVEWVHAEAQFVEYVDCVDKDSEDVSDLDVAGYVHLVGDLPRLPFAYLVVAVGVPNLTPSRTNRNDTSSSIKLLKSYQDAIETAARIVLVGGGAVGVQLATDIKSIYPDKSVTLVHGRDRLLGRFGIKLHYAAIEALQELGVDVILNERVDLPAGVVSDGPRLMTSKLELKDGRAIDYDLLIPTVGALPPCDKLLPSLSSNLHGAYLPVSATLQVLDVPTKSPISKRVFGTGDVIDPPFPVPKMGRAALTQGVVVRDNIIAMIRSTGRNPIRMAEYKPHPMEGSIKLNLGLGKSALWVAGSSGRSVVMKSAKVRVDLDVGRFRKMLGVAKEGEGLDAMVTATRAKDNGTAQL